MNNENILGLINDVIDEAIFHGAGDLDDGPCYSNASRLEIAVSKLADAIGCDYAWDNEEYPRFIRLKKGEHTVLGIRDIPVPENCHECDSFSISDLYGVNCPTNDDPRFYNYVHRPVNCPLIKIV